MRTVLTLVAAAEAATGVLLLAEPAIPVRFLFGAEIGGAGAVMSRFAGACLVSVGIACWPSALPDIRPAARGLAVYSLLAAVVLAIVGIRGGMTGPLLWPAVVLHAVVAAVLARKMRQP
jgi:hypothetical protein